MTTVATPADGGLLPHTAFVAGRWLRGQLRQPAYIVLSLVQPVIWLLLFGQLFKGIVNLPGFEDTSYIAFLTPGVVMMTALMSAGWSGTGFVLDMERGVMDRMLTSPVRRGALMAGQLVSQAVSIAIQAVIVFLVGLAAGARYDGGAVGFAVTIGAAVLIAVAFGSFSNAVALLTRQQNALIGISQFISLPLTFLSSVMMDPDLAPGWVATAARYNPVDWAVVASREALSASPDWGVVAWRGAFLLAFAVVVAGLSTLAFRSYQRSV
jgi:ABC-2 type transport system permease protein